MIAKYNQAILLGWRTFRLTTDMIANDPAGHLEPIIKFILDSAEMLRGEVEKRVGNETT